MMKAILLKKSFVLALFLLATSSVATADEYERVNYLASEIQSSAAQLVNNTEHYQNTPNYKSLVDQGVRLQQGTAELVNLVHHESDIYKIEARVIQLDKCFKQFSILIDSTEFEASQGQGVVQGETAHVKQLLERAGLDMYHLWQTVTQIRNHVEHGHAPEQIAPGGEVHIPIQLPASKQHFGHSPYENNLDIQFSHGGAFDNHGLIHRIQQQFDPQLQFIQQRNFNQQFFQQRQDDQRRQADQQRRLADQQRRQVDQQRRQVEQQWRQVEQQRQIDQQRQADQQRRQADQQRRQADQRRQQDQQPRQAQQQRQRQEDQRRQAEQQRRQADQQRQRQADQRRQADQQRRQADQQRRQAEQQRCQAEQRRKNRK